MKYFFGICLIFVLLCVIEVTSLLNLSKTTIAPSTTTTKKPLQKSTNSLTSSLSKLLGGLTLTKPKVSDATENVIKNSDQSSSAKIETETEKITAIIPELRDIQEKLNVKLPTESETVKEDVVHQDVQEYTVQNEKDENEQELHETLLDIKPEALLTVPIVSDLDIKMLKPDSPLPSKQDDIESANESVSEELPIVDDLVQSVSILEATDQFASDFNTADPDVLELADTSDPIEANTTKPVTDESVKEIPPLNKQELQIDVISPELDDGPINLTNETTESSSQSKLEKQSVPDILPTVPCLPEPLSVLQLTSLESEDLDALTNVDPVINVQPEVPMPTDLPLGIPSGNIVTKLPKVTRTFETILPNLRFEYQPIPENSFGQYGNSYNYRSRPLIDIHDNEISLLEIVLK